MPSKKTLRFTSVLEKSHNRLWGCHFGVPTDAAKNLIEGRSRRVFCSLNSSEERQCALLPRGDGSFVVAVNKKLQSALRLNIGMKVHVSLRNDESKYALPMPEELAELLRQDKEGNRLFHSLTAGKRRTLLYIVSSAKNSESRISKAVTVVQPLKVNGGKVNYKWLYKLLRRR